MGPARQAPCLARSGACAPRAGRSAPPTSPSPGLLCPQDMQRPLYMQPKDALEYGIIDGIVTPEKQIIDEVKSADQWDKEAGLVKR